MGGGGKSAWVRRGERVRVRVSAKIIGQVKEDRKFTWRQKKRKKKRKRIEP